MSRYDSFDDTALWTSILNLQKRLESDFLKAAKSRRLTMLGDMAEPLRKMHWAAAFLGLTALADLAALGSAFVTQLQAEGFSWNTELSSAMKILLRRTRSFCDAKPNEPSPGVFMDSEKAVLQGPELKRPVRTEDLVALFRRRQIDVNTVSACRQLSFAQDPAFSHAITVPKFARNRHRDDRNLTLVYLDLDDQKKSSEELAGLFENARRDGEILLHGPLAIPWKKYQSYRGKRPYYLLLDSREESRLWLSRRDLKGRTIRELAKAEAVGDEGGPMPQTAPTTETKVIIREVPMRQTHSAHRTGDASEAELETIRERKGRRPRMPRDADIRVRIAPKMIIIVSMILIVALSVTSLVGVLIFRQNLGTRLEIASTTMSSIVAKQAENEIFQITSSANLLFQIGSASGGGTLVDDFFANDPNLVYVGVPGTPFQYSNREWLRNNRIFDQQTVFSGIVNARQDDMERARGGETVIINVSPLIPNLERPVLAIAVPFLLGGDQNYLLIMADMTDTLVESVRLQQGDAVTVVVNPSGEVLAHPNLNVVFNGDNIAGTAAFEKIYTEGLTFGIIEYSEMLEGKPADVIGYYRLIDTFNLGVITTVLRADAYADIRKMVELTLYFGLAILLLAIVGVLWFARSLTVPILEIYNATRIALLQQWNEAIVKPRTRDEVGLLGKNFNKMVVKTGDLMNQTRLFVNEDVADMIFDDYKQLPEKAETKDVTVFFSDVRSFTSMSEAMGDPQVVLDNLSEYFDAMVPCVNNTAGTVDKFIGDALMAVWGSMKTLENHAESAINAALAMRKALIDFNITRVPGDTMRPPFQIGCGLHSGPATVGLMGSTFKQEWAHMGPTVNLASRIEGTNADLGTDILISPQTRDLVEGIYDLLTMPKIQYKGIPEPIHVYAVLGRLDDPDRPRTLEELRVLLGRSPIVETKAGGSGAKYKIVS